MNNKKSTSVVLIVLDGWGYREGKDHNAIAEANTPFFDRLWKIYPHSLLNASETHVGLPPGQIGNSEIGHMTMGAGRVIDVDLVRINKAAERGEFITNPAFTQLFRHIKQHNSTLHIYGLVSPGGIHSHRDHLYAFLMAAKAAGIAKVAIHGFTDGRDVPPKSAAQYLHDLEEIITNLGIGYIASVTGRFYAMDRDHNWDRVKKAENAVFRASGKKIRGQKPSETVKQLYREGMIDELLEPLVFLDDSGKGYPLEDNDGVFFFNFRADRSRQLSQKILEQKTRRNICFVTLTEYDKSYEALVAFPPERPDATLAGEIAGAKLSQSHIAETEKYPHVTYFFNGGREQPHPGEKHILVESRKDVKTHDQAPEMRAREIADKAVERIAAGDAFILINFANADMVGHTANKPAIITAVETIDRELKRVVEAASKHGSTVVITADHGNAEVNLDPDTGEKHTAHTLNTVPFIITDSSLRLKNGGLADVAPTLLELLGLPVPTGMTGKSLIVKRQ